MGARITVGANSKQDYSTPDEFLRSVEKRFGPIVFDLAAHQLNAKHTLYYTAPDIEAALSASDPYAFGIDSLKQDWAGIQPRGPLWLNPPFKRVEPWVQKCMIESRKGAEILLLVNAAVGSNWARDYVFPYADVYLLNGRLSFDDIGPFPKDCMLVHYYVPLRPYRIAVWDWKQDILTSVWGALTLQQL